MKNIYRVYDTYQGEMTWCVKKDLGDVLNAMQGALKVKRMDAIALEPHQATLDDLSALEDYVSDNIEVEKFVNEVDLIDLLNA